MTIDLKFLPKLKSSFKVNKIIIQCQVSGTGKAEQVFDQSPEYECKISELSLWKYYSTYCQF